MKFSILGFDNIRLDVNLDEGAYLDAINELDLRVNACSKIYFHLITTNLDHLFTCIIDTEEIIAFHKSLEMFLSLKSDEAIFSSHDELFELKFIRQDGSIICDYWCRTYLPIRMFVSLRFRSDELQSLTCKRELSALLDNLKDKRLLNEEKYIKWW